MKAFTVFVLLLVWLVVKVTFSHGGGEGANLPYYEERMKSTEQSSYIEKREYKEEKLDPDSGVEGLQQNNVRREAERLNDDDERATEKGRGQEKSPQKRSHPNVCPPGWISPWDYAGSHGVCGSNCGMCDGGFCGDVFDSGCGCGECVGCGGCCGGYDGCECGKFYGGIFRPGGRRFPRLFSDGRIQHVWLRDGRTRRFIPSPLLVPRNFYR